MQEEKKVEKKKPKNNYKHLLEENKKLLEENKKLNEKILRLSAETQNMRRHFEEDKTRILKYDGEKIILSMLPVLDNLERAIIFDDANLKDEVSKFLEGIKMIYGNFKSIFDNLEIKEIECIGKEFDSSTMNAVLIDHEKEIEDNIVLDCMQKGYMYKDKIIRPAMVKVNHKESE